MAHRIFCLFIICSALFLQPSIPYGAHAADSGETAAPGVHAAPHQPGAESSSPGQSSFSPPFDETPVALVDDAPITKYDLWAAMEQQRDEAGDHPENNEQELRAVLERLINSRLIVLEAKNIGLDETKEVKGQLESYAKRQLQIELMRNHLQGIEPDPAQVEEMYRKISREVKLHSLVFPAGPEARLFLEEVKKGDFEKLAKRYLDEGKATEQKDEKYMKIKDLRPEVASEVYSMEVGDLSKIYLTEDGHLLYRLVDSRFVEDQAAREEAVRIVVENMRSKKAMEYSFTLQDKYLTFDEELYKQLDFSTDLEKLLQDKRVLAKAKKDGDQFTITVADLAAELKRSFFHGADKAAQQDMLTERKEAAIANMIFKYTSELEARHLGLDQTEEFKKKIADFEISTLFSAFMGKLILPEVKVSEEGIRTYYEKHIDDFSSPAMLQMKSLVFNDLPSAEGALDKLRKGADFNWVSANAANLAGPDTPGILPLDKNLLSLTALPEDLQDLARDAKRGSALLYSPAESKLHYVLLLESVFPPEPQPYEQARAEAGKKVFNERSEELLAEWLTKLKEEYPVRILLDVPAK